MLEIYGYVGTWRTCDICAWFFHSSITHKCRIPDISAMTLVTLLQYVCSYYRG